MSSDSDKEDNEDEENARPQQQGGSIFSQPDVAGLGYRAAFSVHAGSTEAKQAASKAHAGVGDEADAISGAAKNDGMSMFATPLQYATMASWGHSAKASQLHQIHQHIPAQVSSSVSDHFSHHHHPYAQGAAANNGIYMLSQAPSLGQAHGTHLPMFHGSNVGVSGSVDAMMQLRNCGGAQAFAANFPSSFFGDPRLGTSTAFPFSHTPYSVMGRMPGATMDSAQGHLPLDGTTAAMYQDAWMSNPAGYAASLQMQMPMIGASGLQATSLGTHMSTQSKMDSQVEERLEKRRRQNRESQQRFREKKKRERLAQKHVSDKESASASPQKDKAPKLREGDVHEQAQAD